MKIINNMYSWCNFAKICAAFSVVLIHISAIQVTDHTIYGSASWWLSNILNSSARWSVPMFVMISGALLIQKVDQKNWKEFIKHRMYKIFPVIIFWTFFYVFWTILKYSQTGRLNELENYVLLVTNGQAYPHLWYLYMIPGLYLITPLVQIFFKTKKTLLFFIVLIFFVSIFINYYFPSFYKLDNSFVLWFFIYIPYYVFGFYAHNYFSRKFSWWYVVGFVGTFILISLCVNKFSSSVLFNGGLYFYSYLSIFVVLLSVLAVRVFISIDCSFFNTDVISKLMLGVYLIHPVFIDLLKMFFYLKNKDALFFTPLATVLVFFISMLAVYLLKKIKLFNNFV